ncbi:MAG: trigger factor [Patescibacteria group bacterium]
MEIKLLKTEKSTASIEVLASAKEVAAEEAHTLAHMAEETTIKGFRKGKAPLNVVKNSLDPEKLKQRTVSHLLGHAIDQAVKDLNLKVIANPRLTKENTSQADWVFSLEFPLYPEFTLGEYQTKIKVALKKANLAEQAGRPENDDKKLKAAFDTLLDTVKMDIPQALIDEEVNRSLSRLVSQTESLNLSVPDYLKSIKKTPEQIREEYQKTAAESLRLDFLIFAVARDLKLTVSEDEIKSFQSAAQVKDADRPYLESVLLKRKAVDSLLKL